IERLDGETVASRREHVEDSIGIERAVRTDDEAGPSIPRSFSPSPRSVRWRGREAVLRRIFLGNGVSSPRIEVALEGSAEGPGGCGILQDEVPAGIRFS